MRYFALALLLVAVPVAALTAQAPLERKEVDKILEDSLRNVITQGARLYNSGNDDGCLGMYRGALAVAVPLLDHRPELKKTVLAKIKRADAQNSMEGKAFGLREALDDIRTAIRKDLATATPPVKTLWERLGGEEAVKKVVHDAIAALVKDPKINLTRNGKYPMTAANVARLEKLHVEFISAATGGPLKYSGLDMKTAHVGMTITAAEFDGVAAHIVATLKKHQVPQKEIDELVAIVSKSKKDIVEK